MSMDIKMLDVNQCNGDYHTPNAFKRTHKCDERTSYVSLQEFSAFARECSFLLSAISSPLPVSLAKVFYELAGVSPYIPLVLVTFLEGHRYPLPPIGVGLITMHISIFIVFLTTQRFIHYIY